MNPRILLVTTCKWPYAGLLAMAFHRIGCNVEMACPTGHPAVGIRAVGPIYPIRGQRPLSALAKIVNESQPDLVLPCDDNGVYSLHRLYARLRRSKAIHFEILQVLERSLGPAEAHYIAAARSRLIDLAKSEGIRVPNSAAVRTIDDVRAWIANSGMPAVLKKDGTSGGTGVTTIYSESEAEPAFNRLSDLPRKPACQQLNVQEFIEGRDATSSVACWNGDILASIQCEVLQTVCDRGAASVLRLIHHSEMERCAEQLVKRLRLSGMYGFDFRLEDQTGNAHLIEMNARPTQISHLALGTGRNLPVALRAVLTGESIPATKSVTENNLIALFPQEWCRDPTSEFLLQCYHDVPWQDPPLVRACIRQADEKLKNRSRDRTVHRLLEMLRDRRKKGSAS